MAKTKRPPRKGPPKSPAPPRDAAARRRRWTIPLGLVLIVIGLVLLWRRETPEQLYRQARAAFPADIRRADRLLERSIDLAGGNYPEAQVLRCRVLGHAGRWLEASGCFTTMADPSLAPAADLIALADEAQPAGATVLARLALQAAADHAGPQQTAALERLARLEQEQGDMAAALHAAERLERLDARNPVAAVVTARVAQQRGQPAAAVEAYRRALRAFFRISEEPPPIS